MRCTHERCSARGRCLALRREPGGDRHGRQSRGLRAAPGRRDHGRLLRRRPRRVGQRRLRRDRRLRGGAGGPAYGSAEADPLRHHRRDGLGRRSGLRRHDRGLRRAGHGMTGLAPSRVEIQARLEQALAARIPVAIATVVRGGQVGAKLLILPEESLGGLGDATLDAAVQADALDLLARERSQTRPYHVAGHDEPVEVFIETFPPPPTLLIFGAVHVAQPLSRFAKALGFDVIISDARARLATSERFPDADRIIQGWPDETLQQVEILPNTYVAILSHDPKFDEPALVGTLSTPAAYIGAIGSRSTNEDRRRRLAEAGMSAEQIARMRAPIGLDIGAATPEEMAISILGEIIALRRGRSGGSLTHATGRIRGEGDPADAGKGTEDGDRGSAGRNREGVAAAR